MLKRLGRKRKNPDVVGMVIELPTSVMDRLGLRAEKNKRSKSKEAALIIEKVLISSEDSNESKE